MGKTNWFLGVVLQNIPLVIKMKTETLSDKIMKAGVTEYELLLVKDVREFIKKLKAQLHGRLFLYKMELDGLILRSHEKIRLVNECVDTLTGKELANNSPHVKNNSEKSGFLPKHEDTSQYLGARNYLRKTEDKPLKKDICECGHDKELHRPDCEGYKKGDITKICGCKKFKPTCSGDEE